MRILPRNYALVLLAGYLSFQVPFFGQGAAPLALNFAGLAVVILLLIRELLLVVFHCMAYRNWGAQRQHKIQTPTVLACAFASCFGFTFPLVIAIRLRC